MAVTTWARSHAAARAFNTGFLGCTLAIILLGFIGLRLLGYADRLPPPPLTTTSCIDEKFEFMHESPQRNPTWLAVGSSATLHNLDLGRLERRYPAMRPMNGAVCYLYVNQTFFLTRFYLAHYRHVGTVLSVFAMRDFEACTANPTEFFDDRDAARYAIGRWPGWYLYFKNFAPLSFARKIIRGPEPEVDAPYDGYGSQPLITSETDVSLDIQLDPTCFDQLKAMSAYLAERHIRFVVVLLPELSGWAARHDPHHERDAAYRRMVASSVVPGETVVIDTVGLRLPDMHFTDPAHFQWPSVPLFMDYLAQELDRRHIDAARTAHE